MSHTSGSFSEKLQLLLKELFLFSQWRNWMLVIIKNHINLSELRIFLSLSLSGGVVWITFYIFSFLPVFLIGFVSVSSSHNFAFSLPLFAQCSWAFSVLHSYYLHGNFFPFYLWHSISFFASYLCVFTHVCILTSFFFKFHLFCRIYFYVSPVPYYLDTKPLSPWLQMMPWCDGSCIF